MRRWSNRSVLLLAALVGRSVVPLFGQATSNEKPPAFEVASIKRNTTVDSGGGGGFAPGGRFHIANIDVQTIVMIAHRRGPQLFRSQIVGGPDWIASETYDITAKVGDDLAGKHLAELFAMQPVLLRSLLEDRFKLKSHRETRELQRYALVLAKKDGSLGPQLRRAPVDCSAEPRRCGLQVQSGRFSSETPGTNGPLRTRTSTAWILMGSSMNSASAARRL